MKKFICFLLTLVVGLTLCVPCFADEAGIYDVVIDPEEYLESYEVSALGLRAIDLADEYGVGVYIIVIDSMTYYGYNDIDQCAWDFYDQLELGLGEDRDGVLLLLSMEERKYCLDSHGFYANSVFDDSVKYHIEDTFLDNFAGDDWYGGFSDYLNACGTALAFGPARDEYDADAYGWADTGKAVGAVKRDVTGKNLVVALVLGLALALIIALILKRGMRSVHTGDSAAEYLHWDTVNIWAREDHYTHTTETRVYSPKKESSSSGGSSSGGGHSSHSGSF